jgi:hypothetical protein
MLPERITTMKTTLLVIALAALVIVPLASAAQCDVKRFEQATGLLLPGGEAKVSWNPGEMLTATVRSVAFLAGKGLKGLKNGDAVEVTYLGKRQCTFVHVPSGRKLEYVEVGIADSWD